MAQVDIEIIDPETLQGLVTGFCDVFAAQALLGWP